MATFFAFRNIVFFYNHSSTVDFIKNELGFVYVEDNAEWSICLL